MVTTNGKSAQLNTIMRRMFRIPSDQDVPRDVLRICKQIESARPLEGVGRARKSWSLCAVRFPRAVLLRLTRLCGSADQIQNGRGGSLSHLQLYEYIIWYACMYS